VEEEKVVLVGMTKYQWEQTKMLNMTEEEIREFELEVFRLTNIEREKAGLVPVIWDEDLARAAHKHAEDMSINDFVGHTGSDGSTSNERIARETNRFRYASESATTAGSAPEKAVQAWMNSPGHKIQIIPQGDESNRDRYLGVGFSNIDGQTRVVQLFGSIRK